MAGPGEQLDGAPLSIRQPCLVRLPTPWPAVEPRVASCEKPREKGRAEDSRRNRGTRTAAPRPVTFLRLCVLAPRKLTCPFHHRKLPTYSHVSPLGAGDDSVLRVRFPSSGGIITAHILLAPYHIFPACDRRCANDAASTSRPGLCCATPPANAARLAHQGLSCASPAITQTLFVHHPYTSRRRWKRSCLCARCHE